MSVFWWLELDLLSLECNEMSSSEYWVVYGFGMALAARLLTFRVVFLFCWRISMVCLAVETVGSWVELGFSLDMVAFGFSSVQSLSRVRLFATP